MEVVKNSNNLVTHRESDERYEEIENSIHNSLVCNNPKDENNHNKFCLNECFWIVPFGIVITTAIVVMTIVVVVVRKLY
jgi:hypothetical protein